jgi:hypothetical protein
MSWGPAFAGPWRQVLQAVFPAAEGRFSLEGRQRVAEFASV